VCELVVSIVVNILGKVVIYGGELRSIG
jgi:hypothetical protein